MGRVDIMHVSCTSPLSERRSVGLTSCTGHARVPCVIDTVLVDRLQAFGETYLTLATTNKEVALVRCQTKAAKEAAIKAHATIREKNALQL
ncbi:Hypothetical predicted protein [Prunus dulcis]|uniref:Uncharacterized protein n=1 Tax=Prunus dulcis TaxID=3755 RepID=A0A5E4GG54_PRUDU|nr:Hypothetical predicted protein [Prunus dulcis]